MATFRVTGPDGSVYRVTAPDDATEEQAIAYAQAQFGQAPTGPQPEKIEPLQALAMGAGRTLDRLAAGLRQATPSPIRSAVDWANQQLGMGEPPSIDPRVQAENTRIYEGAAKQNPVSSFIGEMGPVLGASNPAALAAMGALEYGTPTERATRGAMGYAGGKVGEALGAGAARLFGPKVAAEGPKLADEFFPTGSNKWNIPLSVGQASQSKPAQIVESVVANMPGGAGAMAKARDRTFSAFNREVSKTFGSDSPAITPEVLGAARKRIGAVFNDVSARNKLQLDETLYGDLLRIAERAKTDLTEPEGKVVVGWLDRIIKDIGPDLKMPGTNYKAFDSRLGKLSKTGGTLGNVLGDLRGALRDGMDRSISPKDAAKWAKARKEYLNLMTVSEATKSMVGDTPGHFTPARLLQAVNEAQKNARFGSGNDLAELAQWAKLTLPDKIPNSGTAQRLLYQKLLSNPLATLGAAGGLGYGAEQIGLGPEVAASIPVAFLAARGMAGRPTSAATDALLKSLGGGLLGTGLLTSAQ